MVLRKTLINSRMIDTTTNRIRTTSMEEESPTLTNKAIITTASRTSPTRPVAVEAVVTDRTREEATITIDSNFLDEYNINVILSRFYTLI